jgi:hypothetical protein
MNRAAGFQFLDHSRSIRRRTFPKVFLERCREMGVTGKSEIGRQRGKVLLTLRQPTKRCAKA